ncbi:DUF177 domain-containing protein [Chloroflexi bacterium TSY]|nr:DUF177 domain-containing protein [Chloroflexi bacterium TSY]
MYFNVAQLLKESTGATRTYELMEDISQLDPELNALNPLVGTVQLLRTHSGILVRGELSTAAQLTCNRCLKPFVIPVRFKLEESFRPLTDIATGRYIHPDEFEGTESDLEDEALLIDELHTLKLVEVVRQNIWLALPLYPTCDDGGLDTCQIQSYDLDIDTTKQSNPALSEDELEQTVDPRWSVLLDLKQKLDRDEARGTSAA